MSVNRNVLFVALAVVCFAVICSVSVNGQSTPPTLAKVFTTNWTIVASNLQANPVTFKGFLALDDNTGAGRLEFAGVEYLPLYIESTFVATPNGPELDGYWFQYPVCWTAGTASSWLQVFPLEIPPSATFLGDKLYNSIECSVWQWYAPRYDTPVEFWVNINQMYSEGQPIAKVT